MTVGDYQVIPHISGIRKQRAKSEADPQKVHPPVNYFLQLNPAS